jgi:hypothetical protein
MKSSLLCFILFLPLISRAQFTYTLDHSIPVEGDKITFAMPWAGGLNATQYNTLDLDHDGKDDLVLFDRMANKISTFLQVNGRYQYAPDYETFFPPDVINFLVLRDINCDGKKDLFTGNILGIKVYLNITEASSPPAWKHRIFYTGVGNGKSDVLLTKGTTLSNLQIQYDDLPAILDADGDGDLDIFSIRFPGNGTIVYHKNFSVERSLSCDSLVFERVTNQWGGVTECSCGSFVFHGDECSNTGGKVEHAGGKSLLVLDVTHDGVVDVVLSEATCSRLSLLENKGTLAAPVIDDSKIFPPITFSNLLYPAAYYEDVDADGIKDLITSTNLFTKPDPWVSVPDYARSNWFYKNTGSNSDPAFVFNKNNFLQDQMIDVGDNAVPAFADMDGDGDFDMLISHHTSDVTASKIRLFENIGTTQAPSFKLIDDDYLDFSSLAQYNLKIQFADINNDGRQDLVFTATGFSDLITRLHYLPNRSSSGLSFSIADMQTVDLDPSIENELVSTENITVIDVDFDPRNPNNRTDILHGKSNGALYFWRNTGSQYTLVTKEYLGFKSSVVRQNISCAAADLDGDGTLDLVLGDQTGEVHIVSDFRNVSDASASSETSIVRNALKSKDGVDYYEPKNLGGRIWPVVVNLFQTVRPQIVVGNIMGGVSILRHDNDVVLPEEPVISIFPNPYKKGIAQSLTVRSDRAASYQIISMKGQLISESVMAAGDTNLPAADLSAGMYIFRAVIKGKAYSQRFVVF